MMIRKYLHSCLVVEDKGKRLLIDLGAYSFIEGKLKPEDIGPVDLMLITHSHADHYDAKALRVLMKLKPAKIISNSDVCEMLQKEGFTCEVIEDGQKKDVLGFSIEAFDAPHGKIPMPPVPNLAYLINGKLLHTGDSFDIPDVKCEILALPIAGPWVMLVDALAFAKRLKPKYVIPVHDATIKDFMLERMYAMCSKKLEEAGIVFKPLNLGDKLEH